MTTNPTDPSVLLSQLTGRAVEAFSLWADTNQKVLRELVDLSASTAKEGVRLYAEIQSSAVEAAKEGQGVLESVESAQRTGKLFEGKLVEGITQAMTRSAERLQGAAEQTGKEIQAAYAQLAGKVQSLSTSA